MAKHPSKGHGLDKPARDNRSRQLNPNNPVYKKSRASPKK